MHSKRLSLLGSAFALVGFFLFQVAHAVSVTVDATSGASGGRKMVTISAVDVTETSSSITFSEGYRNGNLRFYYTTTAFANASDTTRGTVTKQTVSTRGSGTHRVTGLQPGTKYYYRFQGYYPKGQNNYWATGSFTTQVSTSVLRKTAPGATPKNQTRDILGRKSGQGSGSFVGEGRSTLDIDR